MMWSAILNIVYKVFKELISFYQKKKVTTHEGKIQMDNNVTRDDLLDKYGGLSEDSDSKNKP